MSKSVLLAVVLVTLAAFPGALGYIQELVVHKSVHQNGTYFVFKEELPNIPVGLLDMAQAFCTRGFWIGYNDIDFEGSSENLHGYSSNLECFNRSFPYKSFRYGGDLDTAHKVFTVYPQEGYQGTGKVVSGPAQAILSGKSFLDSGLQNWTIYDGQNFNGNHTCVSPPPEYLELEIHGHIDVTASLNLTRIGSVLRGCTEDELRTSLKSYYGNQKPSGVGDFVRRLLHL